MKRNPNILLFICGAGAQLSWLYAWAAFLLFSFFQRIYPLPESVGIFSLAAFLSLFCRRHRWRVIQVIGIHLAGGTAAGLWVVHVFYYRLEPWWSRGWLSDFFNRPRDQLEWFLLFLVLGSTFVFWAAGIRFAHRVRSYTSACSGFDRGIIAFFSLFLVKLTLQTRMGVQFHDSMALLMIFPFFIFSLTEIGLARNQGSGQHKTYLTGYYALGVLASFTIGALIIGTAGVMFFLPYLKMASVVGYDLVQRAANPLGPIVIAVIRFIFGQADWESTISDFTPSLGTGEPVVTGPWMLMLQKVLIWGGWTLLIAMGTVVAGVVLWYAFRWLFLKRVGAEPGGKPWSLLSWWTQVRAFLTAFWLWSLRAGAKRSAAQFYAALRRWGRHSGLPQAASETPLEYGKRLAYRFPNLKAEILLIIEMLQSEVYGEYSLSSKQITKAGKAWKKLHSPLRWPFRIKSIFGG
ncbi:hypothetical protein D1BOALGB6SA_10750 [Olavius sp. associated proteobacterium Delta 1]|nr:hypothetical protein D1BOALGB6SA_10750 [Olavius sp. associated proteobacterium Delta 1]